MARFIFWRLVSMIPVVIIVSFITFSLTTLVPGDPAVVVAGDNASAQLIEQTRERLGLNNPFLTRYIAWLGDVAQGDLGTSLFSSQPAWDTILERIPVTASLTVLALAWSLVVGMALGVTAGLRPGGVTDKITTAVATLGISMPSFWIGILLVSFFAVQNPFFPATGYAPMSEGPGQWLSHLVLPALALGAPTAAEIARQSRAGVVEILEQDYVRTAEAKGMTRRTVVGKHILKNAAIPVVTLLGLQAAYLLGGSVVIEQVFGIQGLGAFALDSILHRDLPMLQAFVLVVTVFVLIINLVVDLAYGLLNPRTRKS
ncbi:ABC transporter permease [Rhodococcoides fascians]|uniref:ABC transporter permease n=1 Tax=Rhodococcoides fascians TaxID=1828 RepID=UPI00055F4A73|nr:ABC transporter permease [Rhodococcus fascians]